VITRVDEQIWARAQEFEKTFAAATMNHGNDWNDWWATKFNGYEAISGKSLKNVLEVGCGPHTNIRFLLGKIEYDRIFLEDPLIQFYITHPIVQQSICARVEGALKRLRVVLRPTGVPLAVRAKSLGKRLINRPGQRLNYTLRLFHELCGTVDLSSSKLEALPYPDSSMDLVICVNVLDHVNDCDACMEEMYRVLRTGGFLVLGQDLTSEEDLEKHPKDMTDIGHPIRIDHLYIARALDARYTPVYLKVLDRHEGRVPRAHYGTYVGILQKV
jgi:SAM-dependent methyltransferase